MEGRGAREGERKASGEDIYLIGAVASQECHSRPSSVFQVCRGGSPLADMLGTQRVLLAQTLSA